MVALALSWILRDALITGAAGDIAREVAQPALQARKHQLGHDVLQQEAAFERGLRAKSRAGGTAAPVGQLLEALRAELAEVRSELVTVITQSVPAAVVYWQNPHRDQLQCHALWVTLGSPPRLVQFE